MSVLTPGSATYNFEIKKGEDLELAMLVRDKETREPTDLTGAVFEGDCRDNLKSPDVLFSFVFTIDPDQVANKGKLKVTVAKEITSQLKPSAGVYDMFVTYPTGGRQPFMQGKITFEPAVTDVTV